LASSPLARDRFAALPLFVISQADARINLSFKIKTFKKIYPLIQ
jgi:hypothetical protein